MLQFRTEHIWFAISLIIKNLKQNKQIQISIFIQKVKIHPERINPLHSTHEVRTEDKRTCSIKSDVIFLLDHSGSIRDRNPANGSWDNWELIKDFVVSIVEGLDVGYEKTHVGLATFGNYAISRFQLNTMFDVSEIVRTIRALGPGNGNTNTYEGLKLVRNMFALDRGGRWLHRLFFWVVFFKFFY